MNRSSVAIALAGLLAASALVLACVGLFQPLFLPAAAASGVASYLLWDYGRERILAAGYGEAGPRDDDRDRRHGTAEDWHHRRVEYRAADAAASDDWDDWRWPGAFREEPADGREGATESARATGANDTDRTTGADPGSGPGPDSGAWSDRAANGGGTHDRGREHTGGGNRNRWPGWEEAVGDDGSKATGGRSTDGQRTGDRSGSDDPGADQRTGGRDRAGAADRGQRQLSRTRQEAADVLGVAPDASPEAVRAAYRERVKETHPDCGGDEAAFRRVRWAYQQLRE